MLIGGCSGGGGWSWSEVCEGGLAVAGGCSLVLGCGSTCWMVGVMGLPANTNKMGLVILFCVVLSAPFV